MKLCVGNKVSFICGCSLAGLELYTLATRECYFTSMVVTLSAGNVMVSDDPLAGIVPMVSGCTVVCP
jgi:hypothetical protein